MVLFAVTSVSKMYFYIVNSVAYVPVIQSRYFNRNIQMFFNKRTIVIKKQFDACRTKSYQIVFGLGTSSRFASGAKRINNRDGSDSA